MRKLFIALLTLCVATPLAALAVEPAPFNEITLDRIQEINQSINEHYQDLQSASGDIAARRKATQSRLQTIQEELNSLEAEQRSVRGNRGRRDDLRAIEENRIEAKSRYLEALAEQHAIDVESTSTFETHATAILINLERLADELQNSPQLSDQADPQKAAPALYSLQRGTAIALTVLEQWGTLDREDPRFRALWATSKVLNRNVEGLRSDGLKRGVQQTVDLVQERIFVVRSLVDQVRALQPALEQKGLLLQVAAQNQMLELYSSNLGLIDGLELPDLKIEESMEKIISDIEDDTKVERRSTSRDPLEGLDDCAQRGVCN